MKNLQYLKEYVEKHHDNKMAWYLLGREYKRSGQEGKANYCFNRAGSVYEAFEQSKIPADMFREYEEGLLRSARERALRKTRIRRLLLSLALLLLVLLPAGASAPGRSTDAVTADGYGGGGAAAEESQPEDQAAPQAGEAAEPAVNELRFTARETGAAAARRDIAVTLGDLSADESTKTAVLGMQRDGKWLLWQGGLPVDYTLDRQQNGRSVIQSYNAAVCNCKPEDAGTLKKSGAEWQQRQEQLSSLWSAMAAYKASTGSYPDSLDQLTGDFPGNWMYGTTPLMEKAFDPLKALAQASAGSAPSAGAPEAPGSIPSTAQGGKEVPFLSSPMTILVDKQKHRLAVASGGVILRSYEVGLGGGKTPVGDFIISIKVVNPNGHDNGEFGSRGMQLSDTNYAIHGTNEPDSIGKDESLGCIRMKREDIEELFNLVPKGTPVHIAEGGLLPDTKVVPLEPFKTKPAGDQTNPRQEYHWLN
ncbi:L,D-transpeptidase [Paenibacillus sp. HN-1]|uniref:L,D-transpeptidase n=1 Tax=Paenibacillus TaxID=44249 RepID=UPI001CA9ACD7|nr:MULTISPECIES: L,D-transpeptidase [Paenibacillus]MBY9082465.1 L,D-transpeptidase [Paenibacillus sp. CGMCC 1.18879]MBY9084824.1 L,D-transpeptidase [Paenibacillus sinensis]